MIKWICLYKLNVHQKSRKNHFSSIWTLIERCINFVSEIFIATIVFFSKFKISEKNRFPFLIQTFQFNFIFFFIDMDWKGLLVTAEIFGKLNFNGLLLGVAYVFCKCAAPSIMWMFYTRRLLRDCIKWVSDQSVNLKTCLKV